MSKFVWLAGLVAVVVLGGFVYVVTNESTTSTQSTASLTELSTASDEVAVVTEPIAGEGSIMSLLERAVDVECQLSFDLNDGGVEQVSEGTLFTSRGRLRSDVLIDTMGQTGVASVIVRDGEVYSWTDFAGQRNGAKTTLADSVLESGPAGGAGALSLSQSVTYDCVSWSPVDASVFEVPSDIIFTNLGTSSAPVMEDGTVFESPMGARNPCEVCRLVPAGPSREECVVNFACE